MGTTPPVPSGSVKPAARARAARREEAGELVHLTGAEGRVKVRRKGSFEWEDVGPEGLTVNAEDTITVPAGGRVTLTDKSGSRIRGSESTGAAAQRPRRKPPSTMRLPGGLVRPARSQ